MAPAARGKAGGVAYLVLIVGRYVVDARQNPGILTVAIPIVVLGITRTNTVGCFFTTIGGVIKATVGVEFGGYQRREGSE